MGVEISKLKEYVKSMQGMYDVVRLVKPGACHTMNADKDGNLAEGELCYTIWGKCDRCSNCTSYQACARHRVQEKTEIKDGVECHVISIPAPVMEDGQKLNSYAIELITYGKEVDDPTLENRTDCATANEDALYVSIVGNKNLSDTIISQAMLDSEIGLICFDEDNNCIYSNKQAFKMFHIPNELSRMQEFLRSWIMYDYHKAQSTIWSQFYSYEGEEFLYEMHLMTAIDENKKELIGSCIAVMDITYEAVNTGGVKYRETHDSLTGIYNQEGFYKAVRAALSEHPDDKYYMICSNIKQFKLVNQLFGMEKGDELLRNLARSLEKWCVGDDIYGRTHSDEFVIFMRKDRFDEQRFRDGVHECAKLLDNSVFTLRFQLGIYEIESSFLPIHDMLDKARMAIDTISLNNKELSIAYYDEEIMKNTLHENEIINSFNEALDNGEFHIFLQPQADCSGKVIGGEALARWIHPEKGIIPPGKFIGVLESANLIYKMDQYVWELAAKQLAEWKGTDKDKYRISVNISPKDLQFLNIEVVFNDLVKKYDIDPEKLNLEITETAIAGNIGRCIELMERLRQKGFIVEMDDFGSGYSSLNLLKDFHVDVLKIDMKFLDSNKDNGRSRIILEHILHMAKALHMVTIAEGVETIDQLDMLKEMGCDLFQGYYFSKPVSVGEFEDYGGMIRI
jgi:diguanylate cyclase (GGDEF)-like protein